MEDGVTEGEAMLLSLNLSAEDGYSEEMEAGFFGKGGVEEEEPGDAIDEEAKGSGGLINRLISTMVTPLSLRTGEVRERDRGNRVVKSEEPAAADGGKGGAENGGEGGIINNLISNFFHQNEGQEVVKNDHKEDQKISGNWDVTKHDNGHEVSKTEEPAADGGKGGPENGGEGGLINNLISNFFDHSEGEEVVENEHKEDQKTRGNGVPELFVDGGGTENDGEGGLINNLISSFFHQSEGEGVVENERKEDEKIRGNEEVTKHDNGNGVSKTEEVAAEDDGGHGGGGGLINNLISNLIRQNEGEEVEEKEEKEKKKIKVDEENEQVKTEAGNGGGKGIIGNIVSHLPASIPDDAVPTGDEATILINSLVRD